MKEKIIMTNYAGQSLRAGFTTTAARKRVPKHLGMEQGGLEEIYP